MDDVLEFLFELVLEGSMELSTNRKVPKPFRILALLVLLVVYGGLIAIVAAIMLECRQEQNMAAFWTVAVIGIGIVVLIGYVAWKKYKEIRKRKE